MSIPFLNQDGNTITALYVDGTEVPVRNNELGTALEPIELDVELSVEEYDLETDLSEEEFDLNVGTAIQNIVIQGKLPPGGQIGDLLAKHSLDDYDTEWITPANHSEQDNTRPITAAAVYTEIGNINALLASI